MEILNIYSGITEFSRDLIRVQRLCNDFDYSHGDGIGAGQGAAYSSIIGGKP